MTRIPGLALYPAIALEFARRHDFDGRAVRKAVPSLLILAAGPLIIAGYYEWRFGDPLAFLHARQQGWNRASGLAGLQRDFKYFMDGSFDACTSLANCVREFDPTRQLLGYWYMVLPPLSIAVVLYARRTLGIGLVVWTVVSVLMALANGLDGTGRFTAVLFPVFIALGMLVRSPATFVGLCAFCIPFLLLFFAQFARWKMVL